MSIIIRDSFDFYATGADLGQNFWDIADTGNTLESVNTRFSVGQALQTNSSSGTGISQLSKSYGGTDPTLFLVMSFYYGTTLTGTTEFQRWRIYDGTTVQCSISLRTDGAMVFYRGDGSTLLGTWTGAFSANAWNQYQFKIVVNNTTGSFEVRKNGNTSDDFSLTGQNTRSSANNQATKFDLLKNANGTTIILDDFAAYTGTSGAPWNDWVGDIRAIQLMPNADTAQKQFTGNSSTVALGQNTQTGTRSLAANTMFAIQQINATFPGNVAKITCALNASVTGHVNAAIYDSTGSGGGPGSLIANGTATAVTNPTIGNVDFVMSTPPSIAANTKYWIVLLQDATFVWKSDGSLSSLFNESRTYGSGFDSPMSLTANNNVPIVAAQVVITPAGNFAYVQELHEDGTLSFVQDANVGDVDLYDLTDLASTPSSILGVSIRGFGGKSDAGARTGCIRLKSGATFLDQTTVVLSTTFGNMVTYQDVDPNTSAAWTASGVNALQIGPKVVS